MSEDRFWDLLEQIQGSNVFVNNSLNKQVPMAWKLLVALANLGTCGNGSDHIHLAYMFHISGECFYFFRLDFGLN